METCFTILSCLRETTSRPKKVIEDKSIAFHGTLEDNEQSFRDFHTPWCQDFMQSGLVGSGRGLFALAYDPTGCKDDRGTGNLP
jgi:hypothetical protein